MFKAYLIERRSWILLFFFLQCLTLGISFIDSAIPVMPVIYIVFLSCIVFIVFLVVRYKRETSFYKSLSEWENDLDTASIAPPKSPLERIVQNRLREQTAYLKQKADHHSLELEQEKDDLLAWIHEVKTPLTTMHLMIDRLEDENLKAQLSYEWLRIHLLLDTQLHQKRILFISNDLLIEKTNLKDILIQEIKPLQTWCMQKGIGFEMDLACKEIHTDAKWFAFMIRQLLTNAIKYSEQADIVLKSYRKDGQIVLEVTDRGRGIEDKDLPRIFDKGFTSTTLHQDSGSSGMGLYLVKKIADALNITIDVNSKKGSGTTFSLILPQRNAFDEITGM